MTPAAARDLRDCMVTGPAFTAAFLHFELADLLVRRGLWPQAGPPLQGGWERLRRQLRALGNMAGPLRVSNHIIAPLAACLGYAPPQRQDPVATREGAEDAGWLLHASGNLRLRAWSIAADDELEAPQRAGRAYRFSAVRTASRVLHAVGEPAALLTNGSELRLLLCDPVRADSQIVLPLLGAGGWCEHSSPPDSYRLLLALAAPAGLAAWPELLAAARLSQARVTQDLRLQAQAAVEGFLQGLLDDAANAVTLRRHRDRQRLAGILWQEALVVIYRLLFILKLESASDPARAFSFATTALWRQALSPNQALGPLVRRHLDQGHDTGRMISDGLRSVFRVFADGLSCSELAIAPLGGALFGRHATPLLDTLHWPEHAAALLLDRLLWTAPKGRERAHIQYGPLNVEELGGVYETLLEQEPGIASGPMLRLRRGKLEVVVPADAAVSPVDARDGEAMADGDASSDRDDAVPDDSNVVRKQYIPSGTFFLRSGLARKASGSYYTPHEFVHYLVQQTLGPQVAARSPDQDPDPAAILALKVVDPATGSGHFLVAACRFLGEALYAACRQCDSLAAAAEAQAAAAAARALATEPAGHSAATARVERASATVPDHRTALLARAAELRWRIEVLPDPDRALAAYLPSRAMEGGDSGLSQSRALAICRRLVAVHCLYGVDRNPLAIELAKLSLWLESYAEGLPLTFLDHRLIAGDSLAGPFFAQLATLPVGGAALDPLLAQGVATRLAGALQAALREVGALQATIGRDAADLVLKAGAKARLDAVLHPLRQLARAWAGAVMLGWCQADDEYLALAQTVAAHGVWPGRLTRRQSGLLDAGAMALPWDLTFPEVFQPDAAGGRAGGFDAVLGNPPWDIVQQSAKEFLSGFDLAILNAPTRREAQGRQQRLLADKAVAESFRRYQENFQQQQRSVGRLYGFQKVAVNGAATNGKLDTFRVFAERKLQLLGPAGAIGMVVPSSFHANEGATGIRQLYLHATDLQSCFSFENTRRFFAINVRQKFALVVARRPGPTRVVRCGFYLDDLALLADRQRILHYDRDFIAGSGGTHLTFLELRSATDLAIARQVFLQHASLRDWTQRHGIVLGREVNITDDAHRLMPVNRAPRDRLLLHEGKTIQQYDDRWDAGPRYAVPLAALQDKPAWCEAARYFRLALRKIARSTDERTAIAAFTAPGYVFSITTTVERTPQARGNAIALALCAVINSFVFDWTLRQKAAATVNLFILEACPVSELSAPATRFLAHGALRLSCNHAGFASLWSEQLGRTWREATARRSWPAVAGTDARWEIRAAMDAVVAQAYGLQRQDYTHVLGSFAHRRYPAAPDRCLAAFDALARQGLPAFCRTCDPYDDVPLVATAATPMDAPPGSGRSVTTTLAAVGQRAPVEKPAVVSKRALAETHPVPDTNRPGG